MKLATHQDASKGGKADSSYERLDCLQSLVVLDSIDLRTSNVAFNLQNAQVAVRVGGEVNLPESRPCVREFILQRRRQTIL